MAEQKFLESMSLYLANAGFLDPLLSPSATDDRHVT